MSEEIAPARPVSPMPGQDNYTDLPLPSQAKPALRFSAYNDIGDTPIGEIKQPDVGVQPAQIKRKTSMTAFVARGRSNRINPPAGPLFQSVTHRFSLNLRSSAQNLARLKTALASLTLFLASPQPYSLHKMIRRLP